MIFSGPFICRDNGVTNIIIVADSDWCLLQENTFFLYFVFSAFSMLITWFVMRPWSLPMNSSIFSRQVHFWCNDKHLIIKLVFVIPNVTDAVIYELVCEVAVHIESFIVVVIDLP